MNMQTDLAERQENGSDKETQIIVNILQRIEISELNGNDTVLDKDMTILKAVEWRLQLKQSKISITEDLHFAFSRASTFNKDGKRIVIGMIVAQLRQMMEEAMARPIGDREAYWKCFSCGGILWENTIDHDGDGRNVPMRCHKNHSSKLYKKTINFNYKGIERTVVVEEVDYNKWKIIEKDEAMEILLSGEATETTTNAIIRSKLIDLIKPERKNKEIKITLQI